MSSVSLFPLTGTFDAFKAEFEKAANKRADHGLCDEKLTRLGQLDDSTAVVVFYDVKPAAWGPFIEDAEVAAFRATFKEPLTVYTSVRPASLPSTIAGVAHFSTTFDEFMGAFSKSQAKRLEYEVSDEARLQVRRVDEL